MDGARIHAENSIRQKNQASTYDEYNYIDIQRTLVDGDYLKLVPTWIKLYHIAKF